ncbi:SIS domain-containing protein [Providencia rettgeri]|uniref:SIS domain-containing protein n=1 Tax=Providencia rettgeri TaxID=587 RepID=UPI002554F41E|nr:SIS domain-containing protein [Providencia rettgeri]
MKAIMPLDKTWQEIISTPRVLAYLLEEPHLVRELAIGIKQQTITQMLFVGSGDSYAIAQFIAIYYEKQLGIDCKAIQSYEFVNGARLLLKDSVVFIITASGRPSPVIDALAIASDSSAFVVVVTNHKNDRIREQANFVLYTGAEKQGIPTQSTTASLLLLIQLSIYLKSSDINDALAELRLIVENLAAPIIQKKTIEYQIDRNYPFEAAHVFLSTGITSFIAEMGCNLLACGPQLLAHSFLIEEYHHSLRLLHDNHLRRFILLLSDKKHESIFLNTAKTLVAQGASVILLSAYPLKENDMNGFMVITFPCSTSTEFSFYSLNFLQVLSLKLAEHWVAQGGVRAFSNN